MDTAATRFRARAGQARSRFGVTFTVLTHRDPTKIGTQWTGTLRLLAQNDFPDIAIEYDANSRERDPRVLDNLEDACPIVEGNLIRIAGGSVDYRIEAVQEVYMGQDGTDVQVRRQALCYRDPRG